MPVCLPHAALILIYWDLARPVRLPLPIIHGSTTRTSRFGGFGLRSPFRGIGYGLIDVDSMSAAVISESDTEHVVVYGGDTAYGQLIDLFDR